MYYHCQGCQNGSRHNSLCYKSGVFETFLVRKKEDIDSINVYGTPISKIYLNALLK